MPTEVANQALRQAGIEYGVIGVIAVAFVLAQAFVLWLFLRRQWSKDDLKDKFIEQQQAEIRQQQADLIHLTERSINVQDQVRLALVEFTNVVRQLVQNHAYCIGRGVATDGLDDSADLSGVREAARENRESGRKGRGKTE